MAYREYIGSRYVPIFGRKDESSIEWDNTKPYEPLTIVTHLGNSYTSRQSVPAGIDITNETYWALTGNYNAQVENYRREVQAYNGRIAANEQAITGIEADNWVTNERVADNAIGTAELQDSSVTSAKIANGAIGTDDIADGAVTSAKIADGAVSTNDIADGAVTGAKIADGAISWDMLDDDLKEWNSAVDNLIGCNAYIDGVNGRDETAVLGNPNLAFKTLDAAFKALDKVGNNFRFYFLTGGEYTWHMRVITGSVVHFFNQVTSSEVTIKLNNEYVPQTAGTPSGIFFYDTHVRVKPDTGDIRIICEDGNNDKVVYAEFEGSTLWCQGTKNVIFEATHIDLYQGSSQLIRTTLENGYINGWFANLVCNALTINNKQAHAALDWRSGVVRMEGNSIAIGSGNTNASNYNAIEFRSCQITIDPDIAGANTGYSRFMACYTSVIFTTAAVVNAMNNWGSQNCIMNALLVYGNHTLQ